MFGQWVLTLRQAEEALRAERLEEALDLARRPELADRRQGSQLRDRIVHRLVERAQEHVRHGHSQAAWHDLRQAERAGAPVTKVAPLRNDLLNRGVAEARAAFEAGSPTQAAEVIANLKSRGVDSVQLRGMHEAAVCWARAVRSAQRGEFARSVELLETAARHLTGIDCVARRLKSVQADRDRASRLRTHVQDALASQKWPDVLKAADAFLEIAPDCSEVRHARNEALRRLGVHAKFSTTDAAEPADASLRNDLSAAPDDPRRSHSRERFILWVDGAGGYLVCLGNAVRLGQANPGSTVDIPILGDLSSNHATIIRDGEGYLVRSESDLWVNGQATRQAALRDRDIVRLGRSVELRFSLPCPVSETARLQLISRHRLHLSLAGILLMADTCVLGPARSHVQTAGAAGQVVLYRQGDGMGCRGDEPVEVDGQTFNGRGPVRLPARVVVGELSFSLEPLSHPLSQV
jgi:hypothetical protein